MKSLLVRASVVMWLSVLPLAILAIVTEYKPSESVKAQSLETGAGHAHTLGATTPLTFTPYFTSYLPVVSRPFGPCTLSPNEATRPGARLAHTFTETLPCLNTPDLVSQFMGNNVIWDGSYDSRVCGENCYFPAWLVYQNGVDDCDGHAILQAYILKQNGYEAYSVGISIIGPNPLGHNVAGYRDKGNPSQLWSLGNEGEMIGPFSSWIDLAQWYIDHGYAYANGTIRLFDPFGITQITTDHTHPSVLELPQIIIR